MVVDCGYHTCDKDGGRIFDILRNFIPNISALNSKHFTSQVLDNSPPSTEQTT